MNKIVIVLILIIATSCSVKFADNLADKGFRKEAINDYKKAMKIYNRAIFYNKKSALAYWRRGNLYSTQTFNNNNLKAILDLTKSIEIDSTFNGGYAYWNRAICKEELNDTIGALKDYDMSILISPEQQNFHCFRGILKAYRFRDFDGALKDLDNAIKLWDDYYIARIQRARIKVIIKDFLGAKEDYEKISLDENNKDDAEDFYDRGIAKYKTGDRIGACIDWDISEKLGCLLAIEKQNVFCK